MLSIFSLISGLGFLLLGFGIIANSTIKTGTAMFPFGAAQISSASVCIISVRNVRQR